MTSKSPIGITPHGCDGDGRAGAEAAGDVGPSSTVVGLDTHELDVLRQVGVHWERVLGGHQAWLRALPIDPGLHRFPGSPVVGRGGRLAAVDFVASVDPGEVVATPHAGGVPSGLGRATAAFRRSCLARRWPAVRRALRRQPGIVITTVPHHLPIRTGHSHMPMA